MKLSRTGVWTLGCVLLFWSLCAFAIQPASKIEFLRPSDLNRNQPSTMPGSAHGHVRQRLEYGKGYRYGHAVNGPLGDIIIWSPNADGIHDTQILQPKKIAPRYRTTPITGPQVRYKPEYGKTSKRSYGD